MCTEEWDDFLPSRPGLHVEHATRFVELHALQGQHVHDDPAAGDRLSSHAVPRAGDRYGYMPRSRIDEDAAQHLHGGRFFSRQADDAKNRS